MEGEGGWRCVDTVSTCVVEGERGVREERHYVAPFMWLVRCDMQGESLWDKYIIKDVRFN